MSDGAARRPRRRPSRVGTLVRLPLADLPATVLPGAVITLGLGHRPAAPRRSRPAAQSADGRVVLRADRQRARRRRPGARHRRACPPASRWRSSASSTRARITAVHASERGRDVRRRRGPPRPSADARASRRSAASCASCSSRSPSCAARAGCPSCCARRRSRARWPTASVTWADLDEDRRREVLAAIPVADRVELVLAWAREHLAELQVAETIRNDVTEGVDRQQREYLLRQQLAAIRKELGEDDGDVVGEYRTRLDALDVAGGAPTTSSPRRSTASSAPAPSRPSRAGSARGWTACSSCRGACAATTRSTSPRPSRSSTRTTTASPTSSRASSSSSPCASCATSATIDEDDEPAPGRARAARRHRHARRPARRRQDQPRRVDRQGDGPQVRPRRPRRHPRRGRDPRPPPHLRRVAARAASSRRSPRRAR